VPILNKPCLALLPPDKETSQGSEWNGEAARGAAVGAAANVSRQMSGAMLKASVKRAGMQLEGKAVMLGHMSSPQRLAQAAGFSIRSRARELRAN
jgi:hypothetical protein